jgi:PhnB protein
LTSAGVPDGYPTLSPYLVVSDADAVIAFVSDVLGGVERLRMAGEGGGSHSEVQLGDSVLMVGGGGSSPFPAMLHVYVEDSDAVYTRALAAGATSVAEPHDTSFGDHRVAFEDPWGNHWWVSTRRG